MKKRIILFIFFILSIALIFLNSCLSLNLNGEKIVKININSNYEEANAKSSFLGKDLTDKIKINGLIDNTKFGEYILEYTINFFIFSKKVYRKVIVTDLTPPEIILNEDLESNICNYKEAGYKAIDDIDGDITSEVKINKYENKIVYAVSDSHGNTINKTRKIQSDNVSPIIKLNNSNLLTFELNSKYVEFGATATDNCDGDISSKIEIISNVDTSKHENFVVIYKVKDSNGNETSIERKIVIYTFDDLNKGYNEIVKGPTYINGVLIVNKKYSIPSSFNSYNKKATEMVTKLMNDAKKQGISLPMRSGNRSYNYQKELYEHYKKKYGVKFADKRAARAGHSEHETGLAFDIGKVNEAFGSTKEGIWLKENCSKYGFIIRYPKYKEGITGYGYEPWHIRYVGVNIAREIMAKEITLEEYLNLYKID